MATLRTSPMRVAALCAAALLLGGCGDGEDVAVGEEREVVGDTTIVRTSGDGEWGGATLVEELRIGELDGADEYTFGRIPSMSVDADGTMYVLDAQAFEVRVYDADGTFLRRFGGEGQGPGEFRQPSAVEFLPDGRLVVRDYGNARLTLFSTAGDLLDSWSIPGGYATSSPMFVDRAGSVYTDIVAERGGDGTFETGLLRIDSTGTVIDTLRGPFEDYEAPRLIARSASGTVTTSVPFWPGAVTTLNRDGEFVGGIADSYVLTTWQADGKLRRIEHDSPRVPVNPDEAEDAVERTSRMMQNMQEDWRWDGPRPPANHPAFGTLRVAADDRLWVRTPQPSQLVPPDADADGESDAADRPPQRQWVQPVQYDVFDDDGTFLGTVEFPEGASPLYMRGDHVWGTMRDEYDVQYLTRWRITPEG